jgi:ParB family transcriptional regulator, chromosome partitioning protein
MATSTTGKNRSILAGLVGDAPVTETPKPAGEGAPRIGDRLSTLARVTSGDYAEKTFRLVDPARCRMWARHNRAYSLLTADSCADLLDSLRAQGEQEFPAVVRRVADDPNIDWEVICGARRHWSVSYLRNVEHRDIKFLIDERVLSDEAAFRLSDLENRARQDISDYERALDYREAVQTFYGGVAVRMAERLEVSKNWLSRFLDLAKLPDEVVSAFGDVRVLRENHARELKPLLTEPGSRARVLATAKTLAERQAARREAGDDLVEAAKVVAALKAAAAGQDAGSRPAPSGAMQIRNGAGAELFTLKPKSGGRLVLELALASSAPNADFLAAFERELTRVRPVS